MVEETVKFEQSIPMRIGGSVLRHHTDKKAIGVSTDIHMHKEYEFLIVTGGTIKCVTNNSEFILEKNDILFINSYTPHAIYNETNNAQHYFLQFNSPVSVNTSLRYVSRFLKASDTPAYHFKPDTNGRKELLECINKLVYEYKHYEPFRNEYIQANIFMIFAVLHRFGILSDATQRKSNELYKLKPIIDYISENYSKELSTAKLSNILSFNESYFCRLFKKTLGTNTIEFINFVRICEARKLLKENTTISEVALRTGFSSVSYFNRVFKKYNYYTPSEYRKILNNTSFDYPESFIP